MTGLRAPGRGLRAPGRGLPGRGRRLALLGALAALAAGCGSEPDAELTHPKTTDAAARVRFADAHQAAHALMPDYTRTIPLSTFHGAQGLAVGVQVAARTETGKLLIGTVLSIGKDSVTVRVDRWQ